MLWIEDWGGQRERYFVEKCTTAHVSLSIHRDFKAPGLTPFFFLALMSSCWEVQGQETQRRKKDLHYFPSSFVVSFFHLFIFCHDIQSYGTVIDKRNCIHIETVLNPDLCADSARLDLSTFEVCLTF